MSDVMAKVISQKGAFEARHKVNDEFLRYNFIRRRSVKRAFLICCIVALALVALSCTPEITLEVFISETDNGVTIENVGNVAALSLSRSPCYTVKNSLCHHRLTFKSNEGEHLHF